MSDARDSASIIRKFWEHEVVTHVLGMIRYLCLPADVCGRRGANLQDEPPVTRSLQERFLGPEQGIVGCAIPG